MIAGIRGVLDAACVGYYQFDIYECWNSCFSFFLDAAWVVAVRAPDSQQNKNEERLYGHSVIVIHANKQITMQSKGSQTNGKKEGGGEESPG